MTQLISPWLHNLFWWTGALIWVMVVLFATWLVVEMLAGVATAVSWVRWAAAIKRSQSRPVLWRWRLASFCLRWPGFIGYRNNGSEKWSTVGGVWRGIGDWEVTTPSVDADQLWAAAKE